MADDDAQALLEQGTALFADETPEAALEVFTRALDRFRAAGDQSGVLQALDKIITTHIAKGDDEEALQMAHKELKQFQAAQNLDGEICMLEQIGNIHLARGAATPRDPVIDSPHYKLAEAEAKLALDRFSQYRNIGLDTAAAEAYALLILSQAQLGLYVLDDALVTAEKASQMFAELGMYGQESMAAAVINKATVIKKESKYFQVEKTFFYQQIRPGIQYGPKYRCNNEIMANETGTHAQTALHLTEGDIEEWERDVAYHAGMIDAGGHSGFARGFTPAAMKQAMARAADPNAPQEGPSIPFNMDHGQFTNRSFGADALYVLSAGTQCYMFHNR